LVRTAGGKDAVNEATKDPSPDVRITAIRAARVIAMDIPALAERMAGDESMGVVRELCLALNYEPTDKALPVLVTLADRFDGQDRWYLEALGIGATGREQELLTAWQRDGKNKDPKVVEVITWRLKKQEPGTAEAQGQGKGRADAGSS